MKAILIFLSIFSVINAVVPITREGKCQFVNEKSSLLGNVYGCKMEKAFLTSEIENFKVNGNHLSKGRQDRGVRFLEITLSNLSIIPKEIIEKFYNLEYLSLNEIGLKILDKIKLKQLKVLLANKNRLTELDDQAFEETKAIEIISLRENQISTIEPATFKNLINLKELYFSSNKLEHLNVDLFSPLMNLQILSLSGNKLKAIDMEHFQLNRQLREILLYDNQLTAIHPQAFVNQKEIFNLELHGNNCVNDDLRDDGGNITDLLKNSLQKCFDGYPLYK